MRKRQRKKNTNKTVTFQLRDSNDNIIEENTLSLSNKDTLIMEFDNELLDLKTASILYDNINNALNRGQRIVAYPKGITLKVLKVNK